MRPIRHNNTPDPLDQKFRRDLYDQEVAPPDNMWDRLSDGLDQHQERIKYDHWYYVALILLIPITALNLMFIGADNTSSGIAQSDPGLTQQTIQSHSTGTNDAAGTYNYSTGTRSKHHSNTYTYSNDQSQPLNSDMSTASALQTESNGVSASGNTEMEDYTSDQTNSSVLANNNLQATINGRQIPSWFSGLNDENDLDGEDMLDDALSALPAISYKVLDELSSEARLHLPNGDDDKDIIKTRAKSPLGNMRGFYAGFDGGVNMTRLYLKNDALYPLLGKDVNYYFDPGYYYSLSFGYSFSKNFALEAEWIINSAKGQRYLDNRFGKLYINGGIELSYTEIPLMAKYKFTKLSRLTKAPVSFDVVAGVSYSRLKTSSINIGEDVITDANEFFAVNNVGFLMGLEYDMYLTRSLYLNLGARASYTADVHSFKTIGQEVPKISSFNLGIHAGVYYVIPFKNKTPKMR